MLNLLFHINLINFKSVNVPIPVTADAFGLLVVNAVA